MKRKLASVQYVHGITTIEGADNIECVMFWDGNVLQRKVNLK